MGKHGNLAPDFCRSRNDAIDRLIEGSGIILVAFGDVTEGRSDQLLGGVMAVEAVGGSNGREARSFFRQGG